MRFYSKSRIFSRLFLPIALLVVLLTLAPPQPAAAHPLGNFSVNHYSRLSLEAGQIRIFYVLDMAEIPTFQQWPHIDTDQDGQINAGEHTAYLSTLVLALQSNLTLVVNGQPVPLKPAGQTLSFPLGQGDLPTLRVEIEFLAALPDAKNGWQVDYQDHNHPDRPGWREMIVQSGGEITLLESTVPAEDLSQALRVYPQDLLQSPLAVNRAEFRFLAGGVKPLQTGGFDQAEAFRPAENRFNTDRFAELITITERSPILIAGALMVAIGLGAAHALTPGHGKTIVGAYLVGSRGTAKHALFLGLTTTITHTAGVFLFGLFVLLASQFILPEKLYPWLGVLSGLLVVAIGFTLLRERWRTLRGDASHSHYHPEHDHSHDHPHHHDGDVHTHTHEGRSHDHPHDYSHNHHPAFEPNQLNWRSLLALGISGGLLPCPSALVLLLSAIALDRVGFGLVLILAFSLGLAGVLTGIGLILVFAGRLFERFPSGGGRVVRVLPVLSALFISVAGIGITVQAFFQTGLL